MKHLFVPYEIALLARDFGFDEPCLTYHLWDGTDFNKEFKDYTSQPLHTPMRNSELPAHIAAPLYQQLVDWFKLNGVYIRQDDEFIGYLIITKNSKGEIISEEWRSTLDKAFLHSFTLLEDK